MSDDPDNRVQNKPQPDLRPDLLSTGKGWKYKKGDAPRRQSRGRRRKRPKGDSL